MIPPLSLIWIAWTSQSILARALANKDNVPVDAENAADEGQSAVVSQKDKSLLLIITTTRPYDAAQRDAIRGTWGAQAGRHHVQLLFVFTDPKDEARSVQNALAREQATHQDMIIFDTLPDEGGDNDLVLSLNALRWALDTYPGTQYFGKVTDDIWLNVPRLAGILAASDPTDSAWILGRYEDGQSAEVKDMYGGLHAFEEMGTLRFALGHLWLMPRETLGRLIQAAERVSPSTDIADAVITGDYRRHLRLAARHRPDVVNMWDVPGQDDVCYRERYLLVHGVFYDQQYQVHNQKCH